MMRDKRDVLSIDVGGFIGDTMHMSAEEIGAYMLILMLAWRSSDGLPDDDVRLARVLKMSPNRWRKMRPVVIAFFDVSAGILRPLAKHLPPERRLSGLPWQTLRKEVFERDGWTCVYCGSVEQDPECDHIIPVSRGGSNDLGNLATACGACNASKRDKLLEEWRGIQ